MQKRIMLGLIGALFFWSNFAVASIISLPRYNADMNARTSDHGRDPVQLSCLDRGYSYTKPSDSCSICIGEDQGCCASIECNKTKGCYAYDSDYADQNSCTLQGDSCYDTATHKTWYKTCVPETCMTEDNKDYLISHNSPGSTSCEEATPGCWWCKCPEDWWLQEKCSSISRYTDGAAWTKFCYPLWDSTEKQRYMLECAAGYYLVNENNGCWHCLQCPSGKTSKPGAVGAESCKTCSAGYGYEGDPDKPCPSGTFSTKCGECKKCTLYQGWTAKKDAPEAATSREEACEQCPVGTYHDYKGTKKCEPCPAGYEPKSGAKPGAYLLKAACTVCPEGTYKASSGTEACTPCPTGTVAISGVTGATSQAQACGKACVSCDEQEYPLTQCPAGETCIECTPLNCENSQKRYKIQTCDVQADEAVAFDVVTEGYSSLVYFPATAVSGQTFTVDWGDCTSNNYPTDGDRPQHTYDAGKCTWDEPCTITITGALKEIGWVNGVVIEVKQLNLSSVDAFYQTFAGMYNRQTDSQCFLDQNYIPELPKNLRAAPYLFERCSAVYAQIPELPSTMKDATGMFMGCSGLSGSLPKLPAGLTRAAGMFQSTSSSLAIPSYVEKPSSLLDGCYNGIFARGNVTPSTVSGGWTSSALNASNATYEARYQNVDTWKDALSQSSLCSITY